MPEIVASGLAPSFTSAWRNHFVGVHRVNPDIGGDLLNRDAVISVRATQATSSRDSRGIGLGDRLLPLNLTVYSGVV